MAGHKKGIPSQILEESPLTQCYGHVLNLDVGDMIRTDWLLRDTMNTTSELSKLIKKSPKWNAMLSKLNAELSLGNPGFRVLCPTWWTVRAESLASVLDN